MSEPYFLVPRYNQSDLDAISYVESVRQTTGFAFLPEGVHEEAYNVALSLAQSAITLIGTKKDEGLARELEQPQRHQYEQLAQEALIIGGLILRMIPTAKVVSIERARRSKIETENVKRHKVLHPELSKTENSVMSMLASGLSPDEIADKLSKTRSNVNTHIGNAYKKLNVTTAAAAINLLHRYGTVTYEDLPAVDFSLTERQKSIVFGVMSGKSALEIATELNIGKQTVAKEIKEVKVTTRTSTHAQLTVAVLRAGGLENIPLKVEIDEKDKTKLFLDPSEVETILRYGTYAQWIGDLFLRYPNTPFTIEDVAKILYGEQYNELSKRKMTLRTHQMLISAMKEPGQSGAISSVPRRLEAEGLVLTKFDVPKNGRSATNRFISHSPQNQPSENGTDLNTRVSEDELRAFAIELRRSEADESIRAGRKPRQLKVESVAENTTAEKTNSSLDEYKFTRKELHALKLVLRGLTNKEIAQIEGLREETIKSRLRKIFEKAGVRNRVELSVLVCRALHGNDLADDYLPRVDPATLTNLTERQRTLAQQAAEGLNDPSIAAKLGISIHTVKSHMNSIYEKTAYANRVELVTAVTLAELNPMQPEQQRGDNDGSQTWREEETVVIQRRKRKDRSNLTKIKLNNIDSETGLPQGFIEQIEALEQKLRNPPPHHEIIRQLKEAGW